MLRVLINTGRTFIPLFLFICVMILQISLAFLSIASIYHFTQKKESKKWESIPYPPSICLPVFGHTLALIWSPVAKIQEWQKKVGPIFKLKMGSQLWIMIDDPYLAHDIFVSAGSTTSSRSYQYFLTKIHALNGR
ncbi:hypothetical protein BY458DRAFT_124822 [Sporodiniella umbellata]|nr:hypothetical protein BY458DRAFT_124822 [Sporodiniella umbellata]